MSLTALDRHSNTPAETDDWVAKPPFRWKDESQIVDNGKYALECFCKRVQFIITANPIDVKICHCDTCKKLHGAPMQTAALYNKTDAYLIKGGKGDIVFFRSTDDNPRSTTHSVDCPRKISCAACGSPLADEGKNMFIIYPSSLRPLRDIKGVHHQNESERSHINGVLHGLPGEFRIRKHIFYGQRAFDILDGIEKWEGLDGKSRRMNDDGKIILDGLM